MSTWDKFGIEAKIISILKDAKVRMRASQPYRQFLTPYQIAIAFKKKYPTVFKAIDMTIKGKKPPQGDTFPRYIATQLSERIEHNDLKEIEIEYLYLKHLDCVKYFDVDKNELIATPNKSSCSLFRYVD